MLPDWSSRVQDVPKPRPRARPLTSPVCGILGNTACPPSPCRGAPRRRHGGYQQWDSRKHFIPRLSAALWPLAKNPPSGWPGEAEAGGLALSQGRGHAGGGGVTLFGRSDTCCWLACPPGEDTSAGETALVPREAARDQSSPPTILSRSRLLAWPRSASRAVSRSPHSGFLQERRRWRSGLGVTQPTRPPNQAPYPPSSDLHLRLRSKSTLLWGEIFPLTAKGCGDGGHYSARCPRSALPQADSQTRTHRTERTPPSMPCRGETAEDQLLSQEGAGRLAGEAHPGPAGAVLPGEAQLGQEHSPRR